MDSEITDEILHKILSDMEFIERKQTQIGRIVKKNKSIQDKLHKEYQKKTKTQEKQYRKQITKLYHQHKKEVA